MGKKPLYLLKITFKNLIMKTKLMKPVAFTFEDLLQSVHYDISDMCEKKDMNKLMSLKTLDELIMFLEGLGFDNPERYLMEGLLIDGIEKEDL